MMLQLGLSSPILGERQYWYDGGQKCCRFHAYEVRHSPRKDGIATTYRNAYCLGFRSVPWAYTERHRIGFVLPRKQELRWKIWEIKRIPLSGGAYSPRCLTA